MGQESRPARASSLPSTNSAAAHHRPSARGRQIKKTFNNIKITILCGLVTILVLRGTIGVGNLSGPSPDSDQKIIEDIDRILREIRSDEDEDDLLVSQQQQTLGLTNSTTATNTTDINVNFNYTLGPKISDWDHQRSQWLADNPGFPSRIRSNRPRILLVTGSPPSPCDNPIGDHYLLKSTKNKIDYSRIHNIEIVYNMAHLDKELAGYWSKLPLLRRLMLSHPEVEWIWWMDSDALFTDMAFELPLDKYQGKNLVIHGYPDLLEQHSWVALNTGSFLFRNCQWFLDLLDEWAPMGPKGPVRDEAGKVLTAYLKGRPAFEADDQSALIYLLCSQKERWADEVFVENSFYLHGHWPGLVESYEEIMEKYHPGFGDHRWPFVTHFVGCKPCGSYGDYPVEKCLNSMEKAFNFADNQVLRFYGFMHRGLTTSNLRRIRNETSKPLEVIQKLDRRAKITTSG